MVPRRGFSVGFYLEKLDFEKLCSYDRNSWKISRERVSHLAISTREGKKRLAFVLDCLCETSAEVSVRFCGLDEMIVANGRFRAKPRPTDVLSFPPGLSLPEGAHSRRQLGDILICIPVAEWQARVNRQSFAAEVEKLIVHGVTHLVGCDHERGDSAWRVQTALEKSLRSELKAQLGAPDWCQLQTGAAKGR